MDAHRGNIMLSHKQMWPSASQGELPQKAQKKPNPLAPLSWTPEP